MYILPTLMDSLNQKTASDYHLKMYELSFWLQNKLKE